MKTSFLWIRIQENPGNMGEKGPIDEDLVKRGGENG